MQKMTVFAPGRHYCCLFWHAQQDTNGTCQMSYGNYWDRLIGTENKALFGKYQDLTECPVIRIDSHESIGL